MTKRNLLTVIVLLICTASYIIFSSNSGGISSSTGGCACHGASNPNTVITVTGIPAAGWVAGTTYSVTVTVTNTVGALTPTPKAGFDLTVSAGVIQGPAPAGTMIMGGTEIHHTTPKARVSGAASWTFNWQAPSSGTSVLFAVAGNAVNGNNGTGGDQYNTASFNFPAASGGTPPTVVSTSATSITSTTAVLGANVNANGSTTSVLFQYGFTTSYGFDAVPTPANVSGLTPSFTSAALTLLTPNTVYHYRVRAINAADTTYSADSTFKTQMASSVYNLDGQQINIFPNPTTDVLHLESTSELNDARFYALSYSGAMVEIVAQKTSSNSYKLHTESLAQGMYMLLATVNGKSISHTFVKKY